MLEDLHRKLIHQILNVSPFRTMIKIGNLLKELIFNIGKDTYTFLIPPCHHEYPTRQSEYKPCLYFHICRFDSTRILYHQYFASNIFHFFSTDKYLQSDLNYRVSL